MRRTPGNQMRLFAQPSQVYTGKCRFFLGTHEVSWAGRTSAPLFLSRRRLARQRTHPLARGPWALDSGGFTELETYGRWTVTPQEYAAEVRRYARSMGGMVWAATQDWMCERIMLDKTGMTIEEHQARTVQSYLDLRRIAPEIPWSPALQGWTRADYVRCFYMYRDAGINLRDNDIVGVGSVCRRQHTDEAVEIFKALHALGLRLHGFGLKLTGLRKASRYLASADSMAWSFGASRSGGRPGVRMDSCTHKAQTCANCMAYALHWRDKVLEIPNVY